MNLRDLPTNWQHVTPHSTHQKQMNFVGLVLETGMTVKEGLSIFDPFFSELRYPQEMRQVEGLGEEHLRLLNSVVAELRHARFQWNQSQ
jgi:hypothetical protein